MSESCELYRRNLRADSCTKVRLIANIKCDDNVPNLVNPKREKKKLKSTASKSSSSNIDSDGKVVCTVSVSPDFYTKYFKVNSTRSKETRRTVFASERASTQTD